MEAYDMLTAMHSQTHSKKGIDQIMTWRQRQITVGLIIVVYGILLTSGATADSSRCDQWAAQAVSLQGVVEVRKTGSALWIAAELEDKYCPGDVIRVKENSRAALLLSNDGLIRLHPHTTITIIGQQQDKTFLLELIEGITFFFSQFPRQLKVVTPFVNAAIEGTEFIMQVAKDKAHLTIFEGRVLASNAFGSLRLSRGQSAAIPKGKAPSARMLVQPRSAVQWAMYYPPVVYWRGSDFQGAAPGSWQAALKRSIERYWQGDLAGAFAALKGIAPRYHDARLLLYKAALYLTVGRETAAQALIGQVLKQAPTNSDALALSAIIAITQNDIDRAFDLGQRAVTSNPASPTAKVALSFVLQSRFQLQEALDAVLEAVALDPENGLAWARAAELHAALGYRNRSLEAARQATSLNPHIVRTWIVLGFADLNLARTKRARESFTRAIQLDSADPLARLGLGLTQIRDGDLQEGRQQMEIAASLSPNDAMLRSYLGKAYFEEKRGDFATQQFSIAKELDPLDPTPWFYEAIFKQTVNRPVEALQDLQKSIELNDNRGVYRSRLMLDSDLAARSASLGRIFNDLGFEQLGLIQGWQSVNADPSDHSGHRLLADLYGRVPRHKIARVSELSQAQLLQPLNITPVGPQLAESDLFILEGAGPADPSFNEFNPLFLRNRFALQASGVVGNNRTLGNEIVQSGLWGNFSYSLGQFHYQTDGIRANNDLNQNIYNAFFQGRPLPKLSILGEYRHRNYQTGDLGIVFDPDNFSMQRRDNASIDTFRFGLNYRFSPNSGIIASLLRQDFDVTVKELGVKLQEDPDGIIGEIQHLYRRPHFNLISGLGRYDAENTQTISIAFFSFEEKQMVDHTNLYVYSNWELPHHLTLTAGLSYDAFDDSMTDTGQFNPKIGLTWRPTPPLTLRLAGFRILTRSLIADQTIEPTQVAGFNQFFDDAPGTDTWQAGAALDYKFSPHIFGGLAFYQRDLDVPYLTTNLVTRQQSVERTDWDESLGRAYLYWTPHPWWAVRAEYLYEKYDHGDNLLGPEKILDLENHRFRLGGRFFHPSGWFAGAAGTYVNQDGRFQDPTAPPDPFNPTVVQDSDRFWVFDLAAGFRFPKRLGILSFEVKNLFNEDFNFQDTDPLNPSITPERRVAMRLTLSF
jgi:tetratricopeptide (TPR) repeat protein